MQLIGRIARQLRRWPPAEAVVLGTWGVVLILLEIAGRRLTSDVVDALAIAVLLSLVLFTATMHEFFKLRSVDHLVRHLKRARQTFAAGGIDCGTDLRGSPPIRRAIPTRWRWALLGLVALAVVLGYWSRFFPSGARAFLVTWSYVVYAGLLTLLWAALFFGVLALAFVFGGIVHELFAARVAGPRNRPLRAEVITLAVVLLFVLAAAFVLPAWLPLAIHAGLLIVLTAALLAASPGLIVLWKRRDGGRLRALDGRLYMWGHNAAPLLITIILVLLARGESLHPSTVPAGEGSTMPITLALGSILAWVAVAGMGAVTFEAVRFAALGILYNPHRPTPLTIHAVGTATRQTRQLLRDAVQNLGWRMRFAPAAARPTDVRIELVEGPQASASPPPIRWPLCVSAESLNDPDVIERLRRRGEVQYRRLLVNGLQFLFKRAARPPRRRGSGVWIALQHWFVLGLTRDVEVDANSRDAAHYNETIGPPYYRVFPPAVRMHFYEICRSLEIDLIFVENGVGFRRLVRVLRVMFETYDVFGGRQPAKESQFTGLPGVRVLIHDLLLGQSSDRAPQPYPEPDYEDVGRARILHVFKDRGEHEEREPVPESFDDVPVLSGSGV